MSTYPRFLHNSYFFFPRNWEPDLTDGFLDCLCAMNSANKVTARTTTMITTIALLLLPCSGSSGTWLVVPSAGEAGFSAHSWFRATRPSPHDKALHLKKKQVSSDPQSLDELQLILARGRIGILYVPSEQNV